MTEILEDLSELYLVSFEFFADGAVYYIERLPEGYVYVEKNDVTN